MKQMSGLLTAGLLVISVATSGCTTTTEYVETRPQCTPPSHPALPVLDKGDLWDTFIDAERWREAESPMVAGDGKYRVLERYIFQLWSFADEQSAMLDVICNRD